MSGPAAARLADGRLHLQHGPIDLILDAYGPERERAAAFARGWAAFRPVLDELVAVLPLLRTPVAQLTAGPAIRAPADRTPWAPASALLPLADEAISRAAAHPAPPAPDGSETPAGQATPAAPSAPLSPCGGGMGRGSAPHRPDEPVPIFPPGSVAERMLRATVPFAPVFLTPMAAVAGAVADHVLAAMAAGRRLERAYVNNGGDAALWLAPDTALTAAGGPDLSARIHVTAESPVRGIATSGWRGRSHSLGIADAVTVLARSAAEADAAATLIANAVDLPGHPAIRRRPARDLAPDSDLGDRPVTVGVGPLAPVEIARALAAGSAAAECMLARGLIAGAALWLSGEITTVGRLEEPAVLSGGGP